MSTEIKDQLKEAKAIRTEANRELKKAINARTKLGDDGDAKEIATAEKAVVKFTKAVEAAEKKVAGLEAKLEKAKAAESTNDNPGRNALVHSVEVDLKLCKKAGVPDYCVGRSTLIVHEYAAKATNKKGELTRTRKELAAELVALGIAKNTVQTQLTAFVKGNHPRGFQVGFEAAE